MVTCQKIFDKLATQVQILTVKANIQEARQKRQAKVLYRPKIKLCLY